MKQLKIFCTSIDYYKIIDKLPSNIKPLGLGKKSFPSNWIDEKQGENITSLNSFYGELTGIFGYGKIKYLQWKNDIIGVCHYRKLWLKRTYLHKQKLSISSLYSNLLNENYFIHDFDCIQVQPIIFKNKNLIEDFKEIHKVDILQDCANFLDEKNKLLFLEHLNGNIMYPLNMFITRVDLLKNIVSISL